MKKMWNALVVLMIVFIIYMAYDIGKDIKTGLEKPTTGKYQTEQNSTTPNSEETTTEKEPRREVSLVAVGDMLGHESVIYAGKRQDGTYDHSVLFEHMKKDFTEADIAVINQETIFGGEEFGYGGYPNFNSPEEIGTEEVNAGFDVILHASNHTRDVWEKGIENCLDFWKTNHTDTLVLGINRSKKAQNKIPVLERNGIKFAMLNYTYGLNGYKLEEGKEYLVNLMDEDKIKKDIAKAKEVADFIVVFPHWGEEYQYKPNEEQIRLAQMMSDEGADLIIGTHPHVLESIEWLNGKDGNKTLCYYSVGNYISGQTKTHSLLGGMATVKIVKDNGKTYIDDAGLVPIVTHYIWSTGSYLTRTYKLADYTEELAAKHTVLSYDNSFSIANLNKLAKDIVGEQWLR